MGLNASEIRKGRPLREDWLMALLLSKSEADCLVHQHKQNLFLSHLPMLDQNSPYRASGLVL